MAVTTADRHAAARLAAGAIVGFGPRGLNARLDITFGRLPGTAIMYLGYARRLDDSGAPASAPSPASVATT